MATEKQNQIYKPAYGKVGEQGWQVDHKNPISRGGTDNPRNLQAIQTEENRQKGRNILIILIISNWIIHKGDERDASPYYLFIQSFSGRKCFLFIEIL